MSPNSYKVDPVVWTGQEGLIGSVVALERFQSALRKINGKEQILEMTLKHLKSLWHLKAVGFYLPSNLGEFTLQTKLKPEEAQWLTKEVDYAIDSGIFGWAIGHSRPICVKTQEEPGMLILGVMRSRKTVLGMFAAVSDTTPRSDRYAPFLPMYLSSVSDAIESEELTLQLQEHNRKLDELVKQRTHQLEIAKEIAEVASRGKDRFLAAISHELRTPLNAILGATQNLRTSDNLTKKEDEDVAIVFSAAEHLLLMINDLLDLALADTSRMDLTPAPVDVRRLLRDTMNVLNVRAQEKRLAFTGIVENGVPETLFVDFKRIRQLLINLLDNAIKFTSKGSVQLRISRQENCIRFCVIDTGVGIPSERIPFLFRPFELIESKTKQWEGTGLGLAISRRIADAMGTTIKVASELEKGSCFWFDLPVSQMVEEGGELEINLGNQSLAMEEIDPERLKLYQSFVTSGDILGLQNELENWIWSSGSTNPFESHLLKLASEFKIKAIRKALRLPD